MISVKTRSFLLLLLLPLIVLMSACTAAKTELPADTGLTLVSSVNDEDYTLEKMVILSRHNVRAPFSTAGSALYAMTEHQWCDWSSAASELSLRGGILETELGQYFRKYLAAKGLMAENIIPADGEVRIYANSLQRTIATARCFSAGMFPVANIEVEYHEEIGTMDPVFNPQLTFVSDSYTEQVMAEIAAMGGEEGFIGIGKSLKENYKLLEDVLDFKDSPYAKENNMTEFAVDDLQVKLEAGAEPAMSGSLKLASSAADALVLQYYEVDDAVEAAFGHKLTLDQWTKIADITTTYQNVLFAAPSVAVNVAAPLTKELLSELQNPERKFAFLCGHDSNILSFLVALQVEDYLLPDALQTAVPLGDTVVIEKWKNASGEEFVSFKMVYLSTEQLRDPQVLDLNNPPLVYDLSFLGMEKNADGMYRSADVEARFNEAAAAYERLAETYQ